MERAERIARVAPGKGGRCFLGVFFGFFCVFVSFLCFLCFFFGFVCGFGGFIMFDSFLDLFVISPDLF